MSQYVDLDFETVSSADLKLVGAAAYAEHPTTEVLCLLYCLDGWRTPECWRPGDRTSLLRDMARDPSIVFVAHNAGFEQAIWHSIMVSDFSFPALPPERWEDTMATCAWKGYPLKLEKAAQVARLSIEKDMEGNRLTLGMSRLNKKTGMYPPQSSATLDRIARYCAQDVAVESRLRHRIGLLSEQSPHERNIWLLDQRINQRGVRIDLDFVRAAQRVVDRATWPLLAEFRDLTGGVNPGQRDKVIAWAGGQGVALENLQKGYLEELLGEAEEADGAGYVSHAEKDDGEQTVSPQDMPVSVRRVLYIRQMLGSASIKKLARMRACTCSDGRARGLLQYHAAGTGRWGGRLLQPQNFPRGVTIVDAAGEKVAIDAVVAAVLSGDPAECSRFYTELPNGGRRRIEPIEFISYALRHALMAGPGKTFLCGDFAGIEMRIVLALAGQHDKCELLATGKDVYLDMACDIWNLQKGALTKANVKERTIGKNTVLGCGFQMGGDTFHSRYCQDQTYEFAHYVVNTYRLQWAPKVPDLWYGLERAALKAAMHGRGEAYGVRYRHEGEWLTALLPSGWQKLWYPHPRLFRGEKFNKDAWQYDAYKGGRMSHVKAYGGLLTENVVQGLARGLLCASMMRLEQAGMPIVLTVHDEIMCEVPESAADLKRFEALMAEPTAWADKLGAPIAVEAWQGERYRK